MAIEYVPPSCWQAENFPIARNAKCQIQSSRNDQVINIEPVYISWRFPPSGYIKINTDGSFMPDSGLAGFGGVARDDKGKWLGGFYGRLSVKATSSLTAELWAIHGGLTLATNYNLKKVIIETDSSEALMMLTVKGYNTTKSHPDHSVMEECKSLISKLGIGIFHTLRQGNNCADHLAKLRRMQEEELVIIDYPPCSMYQLLFADMTHVAYAKICNLMKDMTNIVKL